MSWLSAAVVDLEGFRAHLVSTGRSARRAPGVVDEDDGFFSSKCDNVLALEGSPIDLVVVRLQGHVGPRQILSARAFSVNVNGLPLIGRDVLPVQYHYVLRTRSAYPMLDTKLEQERRGVIDRKRVGLAWTGTFVGPKLAADRGLMDALSEHLGVEDGLVVRADPKRGLVRIIHSRLMTCDYGVAREKWLEVNRVFPAPALLDAFDRIALRLRAPLAA